MSFQGTRQLASASGCGQALYETAREVGEQAIGEPPTVTRVHISS